MNTVFTTTNSYLNEMLKSVHGSKGQIKNSNSETENPPETWEDTGLRYDILLCNSTC